jgi:hypothetical protein
MYLIFGNIYRGFSSVGLDVYAFSSDQHFGCMVLTSSVMQGTGFVVALVAAALFSSPCTAIRATPAKFHDAGVRIRMI